MTAGGRNVADMAQYFAASTARASDGGNFHMTWVHRLIVVKGAPQRNP
ncbi:hypothetical protein KDL45_08365 [bacterium]|nr:hypothetical protein [bacterium]